MADSTNQLVINAKNLIPTAIKHPLTYFDTLMQLGHRPPPKYLPRKPRFLIWQLQYNYSYFKYIRNVDGFFGIFRGLGPKLCGSFVFVTIAQKTSRSVQLYWRKAERINIFDTEFEVWRKFFTNLTIDLLSMSVGVIASHPFHVLMVRSMAQFVGKEHIYDYIHNGIVDIYTNEGILGFFSGLIPRLIGDAMFMCIMRIAGFAIYRYAVQEKVSATIPLPYARIATFRYFRVSTVMILNGSRLVARKERSGERLFTSWRECYRHLYPRRVVNRGSAQVVGQFR